MPVSVSTDTIRPAERQAFWTEAICRSFASVETRPLGAATVSGHFEFVDIGRAKLVRFDSSPQCYSRDARLVSRSGSDDFMFDFQTRGRSALSQSNKESAIEPGFGVLYDARRPFMDRLDGPEQRSEVFIATVPATALVARLRDAEQLCATPMPLSGVMGRSITALVGTLLRAPVSQDANAQESDIVAYLAAILRHGMGAPHQLERTRLFMLIDIHVRRYLAASHSPPALAAGFGISERSFHRIFADRDTTFERHLLRRRVERFRTLLSRPRLAGVSIAALALECGFADAAHASRTFKAAYQATPREYRTDASRSARVSR